MPSAVVASRADDDNYEDAPTIAAANKPNGPPQRYTRSLNLKRGTPKKWSSSDGVRELLQNWSDALVAWLQLNGKSVTFDDILVKTTQNRHISTWTAFEKSSPEGKSLGFVQWDATKRKLIIQNDGPVLDDGVLVIGESTKGGKFNFKGEHGDGMKSGINALTNNDCEVEFFTRGSRIAGSGEGDKWRFKYDKKDTLHLHSAKSTRKDIGDIHNQVRVEITRLETFNPELYLFLQLPPIDSILPSNKPPSDVDGYIILKGELYLHRLFVSGVPVQKGKGGEKQFYYGYNIPAVRGILSRDRTVVSDDEAVGKEIQSIWKRAASVRDMGEASKARCLYLKLFLEEASCLDLVYAKKYGAPDYNFARLLFEELRQIYGRDAWFILDPNDSQTVIYSLHKRPQVIPPLLWNFLSVKRNQGDIIYTVTFQKVRLARQSSPSEYHLAEAPFMKHTLHLFECFKSLKTSLLSYRYEYRNIPYRLDIDVLPDGQMAVVLNARNLLPTWIHAKNETCSSFANLQSSAPDPPVRENDDPDEHLDYNKTYFGELTCDCMADRLISLVRDVLIQGEPMHSYTLIHRCHSLALGMPRSVKVHHHFVENTLECRLTFKSVNPVAESIEMQTLFRAVVTEIRGDISIPDRLLFEPTGVPNDAMEGTWKDNGTHFTLSLTSQSPEGLVITGCRPGSLYRVQVCQSLLKDNTPQTLKAFWSCPSDFRVPLAPPQGVRVTRQEYQDRLFGVSWEPVEGADRYSVRLLDAANRVVVQDRDILELRVFGTRLDVIPPAGTVSIEICAHAVITNNEVHSLEPAVVAIPRIVLSKRRLHSLPPEDVSDGEAARTKRRRIDQESMVDIQILGDGFGDDTSGDEDDTIGRLLDVGAEDYGEDEYMDEPDTVSGASRSATTQPRGTHESASSIIQDLIIGDVYMKSGTIVEFSMKDRQTRLGADPSQSYIGIVLEILETASEDRGLRMTVFEFLKDHIGKSLDNGNDDTELILISRPSEESNHLENIGTKLDSTYVAIGDIATLDYARHGQVFFTAQPQHTSVIRNVLMCRCVSLVLPSSGMSFIMPPPDYLISNPRHRHQAQEIDDHVIDEATVADLFSNGGGKSQGFKMAGFRCLFSADSEQCAFTTYDRNFTSDSAYSHSQAPSQFLADVSAQKVTVGSVTVVLVSPPLMAGTPGLGHDSMHVMADIVRQAAEIIKAPYIVIDMAPRVLRPEYQPQYRAILHSLLQQGYSVTSKMMRSENFGLPHCRSRLVVVAAKTKLPLPKWPDVPTTRVPTVRDALAGLVGLAPREREGGEAGIRSLGPTNPVTIDEQIPYARDLGAYEEGRRYVYNHGVGPDVSIDDTWTRAQWDTPLEKVSKKLGSDWPCLHPDRGDLFTVRELARIMSYPDSFRFYGTLKEQYKMVGNSMPPLLARLIADMIKESIEEYKRAR